MQGFAIPAQFLFVTNKRKGCVIGLQTGMLTHHGRNGKFNYGRHFAGTITTAPR